MDIIQENCIKIKKALNDRKITPSIFINIGVGSKNTEAKLIKSYWPSISILGIEPSPKRFNHIKKSFPGKLLNIAVGEEDKKNITLYGTGLKQPSTIYSNLYDEKNKFNVKQRTLDSIIKENFPNKQNILVWADIEGAELMMLKGAVNSIKNNQICAFHLEVWNEAPKKSKGNWVFQQEIDEFLFPYNFTDKVSMRRAPNHDFKDVLYIRK